MRRYLAEGEYDAVEGALVYGVDHLGSVRDVIAASGQKANHFDYDPYGNSIQATGSRASWTDFRYAGLFYHQASGLYLATNRAYDPEVGRWLSRDPIGERGGFNLYAYVQGNPVGLTDPLGLTDWAPLEQAVGQAAVTEAVGGGPEDPVADVAALAELANGLYPQPSPHFEAAIAIGKSPAPATASANFAMSGASRCSGMVGISS
jgi:RHS repeat-associated protein